MDADAAAELRRLRARAYGPGADIHDDPAALRRLEELEQRARPVEMEAPMPPPAPDAETAVPVETDSAAAVEPDATEDAGSSAAAPSRRLRVWLPSLWIASLVVVGLIAGLWTLTTTLTFLTPIQRQPDTRQVGVLTVDPDFVMPAIFGTTSPEHIGFQEFYGLTVVATPGSWMGGYDPDGRCLLLLRTADIDDDQQVVNGPIFNDCSAGTFPATVEIVVNRDVPQELRDRFSDGTALQFVLDGDRVGVFSDAD